MHKIAVLQMSKNFMHFCKWARTVQGVNAMAVFGFHGGFKILSFRGTW